MDDLEQLRTHIGQRLVAVDEFEIGDGESWVFTFEDGRKITGYWHPGYHYSEATYGDGYWEWQFHASRLPLQEQKP